MKKSKFSIFNDGVLKICEPEDDQTDFSAVTNTDSVDDLEVIYKLNFSELSKRDQDLQFAESLGRTLNLKVKCRYVGGINKLNLVLIGDMLYSIINMDEDRARKELYLYLEEVRKLA